MRGLVVNNVFNFLGEFRSSNIAGEESGLKVVLNIDLKI